MGIFKAPEACKDRKGEQRLIFHGKLILNIDICTRMTSSFKIRESLEF